MFRKFIRDLTNKYTNTHDVIMCISSKACDVTECHVVIMCISSKACDVTWIVMMSLCVGLCVLHYFKGTERDITVMSQAAK